MIILDTNVVSEPLRQGENPIVAEWMDRQDSGSVYLTATVLAEVRAGFEVMPAGRRRDELQTKLDRLETRFTDGRILPFDIAAAKAYGVLLARARSAGKAISFSDGQIAAIALVKNFAVATRDAALFLAAGVRVIDPWRG